MQLPRDHYSLLLLLWRASYFFPDEPMTEQNKIMWFFSQVAFRRRCGETFPNPSRGPMTDPESVPTQAFSAGMSPRASPTPIFIAPVRGQERETARERAGRGSIDRRARARKKSARNDPQRFEHWKIAEMLQYPEGSV